jgi:hypothetical protein
LAVLLAAAPPAASPGPPADPFMGGVGITVGGMVMTLGGVIGGLMLTSCPRARPGAGFCAYDFWPVGGLLLAGAAIAVFGVGWLIWTRDPAS